MPLRKPLVIREGGYYECLRPPMSKFTKNKDYEVFRDSFGRLRVHADGDITADSSSCAVVWIDSRNFRDVTGLYVGERIQIELLPFKWEDSEKSSYAVGINHTYTVLDSDDEGVVVKWHNTLEDDGDTGYGFDTIEAAKVWVEKTHHPAQLMPWARFIKDFNNGRIKAVSDSVPTKAE